MKRALLIGIDTYDSFPPLSGCVGDVSKLLPLLSRNYDDSPNFHCQTRVSSSENVSRREILTSVEALLAPGADIALLYFAGHGVPANNDVVLVAQDGGRVDPGVALSTVLGVVAESKVREVVIILDCCFAGGAGGIPQMSGESALLRAGVAILSASRNDQPSIEIEGGGGIFSTYLAGALEGGAADVLGKVTIAGIYAYLSESFGPWDQRPTFKANVDRLHELRVSEPAVPISELRALRGLFGDPHAALPLDPSFEPTAEPRNEKNEEIFAALQRCRAAKLVEPVDADHLYFAAMESKSCRLTPLGVHYWRMASEGRL